VRFVRLAPLLALLFIALLPCSALADVTRAESVLPPGQSGFISQDGTTQSPHLYDQVPLYTAFQWKPAMFGQPGATEAPRAGVSIVRDAYGVPSVTGATGPDAWWGAGYAVAQDRLAELELFRRQASGRLAEILGPTYLSADIVSRRDFYTPAELDKQVAALPPELRARDDAYAAGVNAWIQHVRENPQDLPNEFKLFNIALTDWTARDTAAIGVLLARTVPSSDGNELPNARTLRAAGAKAFDSLVPRHVQHEPTIIPRADGLFPSQPGRTSHDEQVGLVRSRVLVKGLALPAAPVTARRSAASRVPLGRPGGSYTIAARRNGDAWLYSGPQLGFAYPELFVELEVHAPGLDVRGATAPGVPVIAVGHNAHVAWGVTSGESDDDDLYAETLKGGTESYLYKGKTLAMSCRDEVFNVSGADPHTERLCRTRHGPVQARSTKQAYARRYAIWGRELETFVGLEDLNAAKTVKEVDRATAAMTWNENITAADDAGNIGFWHPGLLPLKPRQWDERLPFPGTGEAEWRGFLSVKQRPHVINPTGRNWLANWNNQPSAGWTEGDIEGASRGRAAGALHRAAFLYSLVPGFAKKPSIGRLESLLRSSGTTAQQRPLMTSRLEAASTGSSGNARKVLTALLAWDGSYARTASDGTVDPGVPIWEEFKSAMLARDQARLGGSKVAELAGRTASYHLFDITGGEAHALLSLGSGDYRAAAATVYGTLAQRFGSTDPAKWRQPRTNVTWTLQGVGSPPAMPFFERGTWEQLVELR
jgi:penicillin amidase